LGFVTFSDPLLRPVFYLGMGILLACVSMLGAIVMLRLVHGRARQREQRLIALWRPLLAQCMDHVPAALPPIAAADHYAFLKLWNVHHEALGGSAKHHLNGLALRTDLTEVARTFLSRGNLKQQLIAITALGHLGDDLVWADLRKLVDHESPLLSLAAARALLQLHAPEDTLEWLLPVVTTRLDWPLPKVARMLSELGPGRVTLPLAREIEAAAHGPAAPQQVPRLLRLLDTAYAEKAAPAVRRVLEASHDPGVIAACLRTLNYPGYQELLRRYWQHPDSTVRTETANALGRIGMPEDKPQLVHLLTDSNWQVRHAAAQALAALPFVSRAELHRIRTSLTDRFAQDMLDFIVAEKPGHDAR